MSKISILYDIPWTYTHPPQTYIYLTWIYIILPWIYILHVQVIPYCLCNLLAITDTRCLWWCLQTNQSHHGQGQFYDNNRAHASPSPWSVWETAELFQSDWFQLQTHWLQNLLHVCGSAELTIELQSNINISTCMPLNLESLSNYVVKRYGALSLRALIRNCIKNNHLYDPNISGQTRVYNLV